MLTLLDVLKIHRTFVLTLLYAVAERPLLVYTDTCEYIAAPCIKTRYWLKVDNYAGNLLE